MADNFTAGAYTFGSDDIAGVHSERVKIILGGDGTNSGDMASGAGAVGATVPRVTLASDDPAVVDLAAIEVLLTGMDADTDAIKTSVQLLDNAISGAGFNITQLGGAAVPIGAGTEATAVRVTIATDSTGTLSIDDGGGALTVDGTVTANLSATDNAVLDDIAAKLGTIDADTSAVNDCVKAEDAAHSSGDKGLMALAVRTDTAAARAGTDGDYAPLEVDAIGRLHANNTEVSGSVYDGTTLCTVLRFMVAAPSDGDSLIAAVADKKFRILSFGIVSISGTICRFWLDDADGTAVFGNSTGIALEEDSGAAPPGFILPYNPHGWFQTATANKALRIQFASGSGVVVFGSYIQVA